MAINLLKPPQKDRAALMLTQAFDDDPLYKHIFPEDNERSQSLQRLFGAVVAYGLKYGQVYTTPAVEGVACWLTPGNTEVTLWRMLRTGMAFQRATARMGAFARNHLLEALAFMNEIHLRLMSGSFAKSHWYLWAMGVNPDTQGRGIGGKLIQPTLSIADQDGFPCYLETLNEKSLTFYSKWGFKLENAAILPVGGVRVWSMVRKPRHSPLPENRISDITRR